MTAAAPWEAFLAEHFPGYLLPEAETRALPEEAAARFLERIGGRPQHLFLLRAASVLSAHVEELRALALHELPDLLSGLPRRAEMVRRASEGEVRGPVDVPATLALRLEGRRTSFVVRARRTHADRLENVFLKAVAARLLGLVADLRSSGVLSHSGWGAAIPACEDALGRAISTSALRDVPDAPIGAVHEQAAIGARHRAYALAWRLHRALREGLDSRDPARTARAVAAGALAPLSAPTRFELAVLLRLIQALARRVDERAPGRWTLRRTIILTGRREVASLERDDGASVRLHYDQAHLDPGPYDAGLRRYFGRWGRLRPDITVIVSVPGAADRAAVVEVKLSSDMDYLVQGYREALLYRAEYAESLTGWPKAILVTSANIAAAPSHEDEVIAVSWDRWVPEIVLDGLLEGL